jgi:hypothetical protein
MENIGDGEIVIERRPDQCKSGDGNSHKASDAGAPGTLSQAESGTFTPGRGNACKQAVDGQSQGE